MGTLKNKPKKGLCHGVFDLIHIGHIKHFLEAKKYCDYLVVSLTSDKYVKKSKGPNKPIFNEKERFKFLTNLRIVDEVIISNCETAEKAINKIKPDIYFKGKDYKKSIDKNLKIEKKIISKTGGKIMFTDTPLNSSSEIINLKKLNQNNEIIKILNNSEKLFLKKKLHSFLKKKIKSKILILGEHILDTYISTNVQGKSGKNNILTSSYVASKSFGGGIMLVSNLLSNFVSGVDTICWQNKHNSRIYKQNLNKNTNVIKFKTSAKIIEKKRFLDSYLGTKLFQLNTNQEEVLTEKFKKNFYEFFNKLNLNKYDAIIVFDYGHGLISKKIITKLNRYKNKTYINCQSNSFNFGYNLISKYNSAKTISMDESEFRLLAQDKFSKIRTLIDNNINLFRNFQNTIITMGKFGAFHINRKNIDFVKTVIPTSKDTTGCGDIFFSIYILLDMYSNLNLKEKLIICHLCAGVHAEYEGNDNKINKDNLIKFAKSYLF